MTNLKGTTDYGAWLLALGGAVGVLVSLYDYSTPATGISGAGGTVLVVISSALILGAALVIALWTGRPRLLRGTLTVLLFLGLLGTTAAAYFLESGALMGTMGLGFIGWLLLVFQEQGRDRYPNQGRSIA